MPICFHSNVNSTEASDLTLVFLYRDMMVKLRLVTTPSFFFMEIKQLSNANIRWVVLLSLNQSKRKSDSIFFILYLSV